jgi:hypothetical protein
VQAYWLFRELWTFDDGAERAAGGALSRGFQGAMMDLARTKGWTIDMTADLARVLRVPGTWNRKLEPCQPVRVLRYRPQRRYTRDDFLEYITVELPRDAPAIEGTITNGKRHTTFTSWAGTMRRRGMSAAAIYAALGVENQTRCDEPMDEDELRAIADDIGAKPPAAARSRWDVNLARATR